MIQIVHGKNTYASYLRLKSLINVVSSEQRVKLSAENTLEDLYQAVLTESLIDDKKLIVCENFLTSKKIKPDDKLFLQIPQTKNLILWEADNLTPDILKKLPKSATIEFFKPEPKSFWFLDSILPYSKTSLSKLQELEKEDKGHSLLSSLASRALLLVLAKKNLDIKTSSAVSGYNLQPWQWTKIKTQASSFSLENLKAFFNGILKADLMIKTGVTSLPEETIISLLLVKYLRI